MNIRMRSIPLPDPTDTTVIGCTDIVDYRSDSKIQYQFNEFWIEDGYAWNIDNATNASPSLSCPVQWSADYRARINMLIDNNNVPEGIHIIFPSEGSSYQKMIVDGTIISSTDFNDNIDGTDCSEEPSTTTLNRRSFINMENEYLDYYYKRHIRPTRPVEPQDWILSNETWSQSRVYVHELAHSLGLHHDDTCSENMIATNNSQGFLSTEQLGFMHHILAHSNVRNFVCCEKPGDTPWHITAEETWDLDTKVYTDIIVETGGELTIACKLLMPKDGKIIVKRGARLIVKDAEITFEGNEDYAECVDERWRGITVWGNGQRRHEQVVTLGALAEDDPGVVIINNSTISNAVNAISTSRHDRTWDRTYWGGIVRSFNSTFLNNKRSAEFLFYKYPNSSFFRKCHFETTNGDAYAGVTMWATKGIDFEGCSFKNLGDRCIETYDATTHISENCSFEGTNFGVLATATAPLPGAVHIDGSIGANMFAQNNIAISTNGLNLLQVDQNTFNNNNYGVYAHGNNGYNIFNNTFDKHIVDVETDQAGLAVKQILCNTHSRAFHGIRVAGNNQGLEFDNETFAGTTSNSTNVENDVFITKIGETNGAIRSPQGDPRTPRFNYFSIATQSNHIVANPNNTIAFDYYVPDPSPENRLLPGDDLPINNFNQILSLGNQNDVDCGNLLRKPTCTTRDCLDIDDRIKNE